MRIQEAVTGISEEMSDVNLAVERAQDKVLQMQARASAMDELVQAGTLPEIGTQPGDDIDRQLKALAGQSDVDRELAAMKSQMQIQGPQQGQAQLPPADS